MNALQTLAIFSRGSIRVCEIARRGAMRTAVESARRMVKEAHRSISVVPRNRYVIGLESITAYLDGLLIPYLDLK